MVQVENFSEKEQLASDLERVGAKVEAAKEKEFQGKGMEKPVSIKSPEKKKEIVKRAVGEMAEEEINRGGEEQPLSEVSSVEEENYLPDYMEGQNVDEQTENIVETLLQVAVDKGIMKAFRDSKKYPPFIQDAFHDALVDKLIPELERRGKL